MDTDTLARFFWPQHLFHRRESRQRPDNKTNTDKKRYYDKDHKDYHDWNDNEDREYRQYLSEHHRDYRDSRR